MLRRALFATVLYALPLTVQAQEPDDMGGSGRFEVNGSSTTGNNDVTNVGASIKLKNRGYDWRHDFAGSADFGAFKNGALSGRAMATQSCKTVRHAGNWKRARATNHRMRV